jgi:hypothetical protein
MSRIRVAESRPYDQYFDPVFTGPFTYVQSDPRVAAAVSSSNMVAGRTRYKYFKRPLLPRMNAVPPNVLLAPTVSQDPLKPVELMQEPLVKDVEVQTAYRESEAQTLPYSPDHVVADGHDPEILLLKNLSVENGLPLGKKELEMLMHARAKKDLESNLPPYTDEASVKLRQRLMEQQDTKEFKLRENEMDATRELRLQEIERALRERDESAEYVASQRIEAMRQFKLDERENILQKIRSKRIKVLRRLANQRNAVNPMLTNANKRDIISDYFDKGSHTYAPLKREGIDNPPASEKFDVMSRTAPLDVITNVINLEASIPESLLKSKEQAEISMLKTLGGTKAITSGPGSGNAYKPALTSQAQRNQRNTIRDVEEMHQILLRKKRLNLMSTGTAASGEITERKSADISTLLARKPKGRPVTPDLTTDAQGKALSRDDGFDRAVILLQRLLRGRAVQNIMYEGRHRRRELIAELRGAEEAIAQENADLEAALAAAQEESIARARELAAAINQNDDDLDLGSIEVPPVVLPDPVKEKLREQAIRSTTVDAVAGTVTSSLFFQLSLEKERLDAVHDCARLAQLYKEERRVAEAVEAGRRQKENIEAQFVAPEGETDTVKRYEGVRAMLHQAGHIAGSNRSRKATSAPAAPSALVGDLPEAASEDASASTSAPAAIHAEDDVALEQAMQSSTAAFILEVTNPDGVSVMSDVEGGTEVRRLAKLDVIDASEKQATADGVGVYKVSNGWVKDADVDKNTVNVQVLRHLLSTPQKFKVIQAQGGAKLRNGAELDSQEIKDVPYETVIEVQAKRFLRKQGDSATRMRVFAPPAYAGWVSDRDVILVPLETLDPFVDPLGRQARSLGVVRKTT